MLFDIQEIPSAQWQSPQVDITKEEYVALIKKAELANEDPTKIIIPTRAAQVIAEVVIDKPSTSTMKR